ncbi:MAG TPA: hypothetical protein VFX70_16530 [Mycobacteriales bacterium]|nr:hypothetical protein [Mycobacteriales bacterium]
MESDDYRVLAEAAGVVELPDGPEPDRPAPDRAEPDGPGPEAADVPPSYRDGPDLDPVLGVVLTGRWVDDDPGPVGK